MFETTRTNPELFEFCEDAFIHLDESSGSVMANFPLFFALHLRFSLVLE
jgi:DNA repair protein RecO (recombination protein O)